MSEIEKLIELVDHLHKSMTACQVLLWIIIVMIYWKGKHNGH